MSRLIHLAQDLVSELKRRKVFRVAGVYAVVAFVVVQVADIVFPALHLPGWTVTLVVALAILGFPIALVLAWALEVTPDGVKRTEPAPTRAPDASTGGRDSRRIAFGLVVGFFLAVAGLGAYGWIASEGTSAAEETALDPHRVAVFPFTVRGSPELEYLGESMVELLGRSLDGAGSLRTVDHHALLSRVTRHSASGVLSPGDAHQIASGFGAGRYVLGTIVRVGEEIRLSASWYREEGEPLGNTHVVAAGEAEIQSSIDALARRAIGALVADIGDGLDRRERLAAQTTSSTEALKAYLEGQAALRRNEFEGALRSFQHAVQTDSTFALAHYRLSVTAAWTGTPDIRLLAARRADELAEGLPERDRRLIRANEAQAEHRGGEAEGIYRLLIESDPHDVEAWYQLGETLFHLGPEMGRPATEARVPFMTALELDPTLHEPRYDLIRISGIERDFALLDSVTSGLEHRNLDSEIEAMFQAVRAYVLGAGSSGDIDLNSTWAVQFAAELISHWGMFEEAEQLLRTLTTRDRAEETRKDGHLQMAWLLSKQGRIGEAEKELSIAEGDDGNPIDRAYVVTLPFLPDTVFGGEERSHLLARVESWSPESRSDRASQLTALGYLLAAMGDADGGLDAAARLAEMEAPEDWPSVWLSDLARSVRVEVEIRQRRPARALEMLEAVEAPLRQDRFRRAELLAEMGRLDEALGWYETLDIYSGWIFAAPAYLGRAQVLERLGRPEEAAEAYERFLELWQDADEPLQRKVREARQRLEDLTGAERTAVSTPEVEAGVRALSAGEGAR